ncbi:MAG: metalloregulator ArsR/SmtB family transcription factor [Phycisphaerales bacterium]|nr:metalloregulator ArsR/SmtB family transcription factor [Phycisphaerales bacterium]
MVEHAASLDRVFRALADPTRRRILGTLAAGERSVTELAEPFDMSLAAASKHLKTLEHAGLLRRTRRGRTHLCRLEPTPLAAAHQWLAEYEQFWSRRLDELERLLRADQQPPPAPPAKARKSASRRSGAHG